MTDAVVAPKEISRSRLTQSAIAIAATAMVLIGLVLLYLLTQATNNRDLYEQTYSQLFTINVVVAALLLAGIVWVGVRLYLRVQQGRFGSRLLVKIATIFALVGVAPGVLIYIVSYQFVSRSIETWFDVKVESALEAGLNLGRVTLDTLSNDLAAKTRSATSQLSDNNALAPALALERVLDQLDATEATLWGPNGTLIASAGQSSFQLSPDQPSASQFRTARAEKSLAWVEGLEEVSNNKTSKPRIKVLVPISSSSVGLMVEQRFLLIQKTLPSNFVLNALAVESANREYQERAIARSGLKRMYIGTLTLSLFLAVFGAVLLAVLLGNQIARPLLVLTEGVSQVAAGDLTPKLAMQGNDELGGLTRAFAAMTQQLSDARFTVQRSMEQVDSARANLQTILDNLTSGVMVLQTDGAIRSSNPGAARILQVAALDFQDKKISELSGLEAFGLGVQQQFSEFSQRLEPQGQDHWQHSFELGAVSSAMSGGMGGQPERSLTLIARGAFLPDQSRLVNDFRDYARLPAAELKPVDLNALVSDVLQLYESASVPITTDLDSNIPLVTGDAQQLRQVLHNLLQNAQDASEQTQASSGAAKTVVVRTQWVPASERVRLSVLDQGVGFPDHILKRAFEPYVTTKARGTGLGLAVVKKIADDHASRIDISNRIAEGLVVGAQVSLSLATVNPAST